MMLTWMDMTPMDRTETSEYAQTSVRMDCEVVDDVAMDEHDPHGPDPNMATGYELHVTLKNHQQKCRSHQVIPHVHLTQESSTYCQYLIHVPKSEFDYLFERVVKFSLYFDDLLNRLVESS